MLVPYAAATVPTIDGMGTAERITHVRSNIRIWCTSVLDGRPKSCADRGEPVLVNDEIVAAQSAEAVAVPPDQQFHVVWISQDTLRCTPTRPVYTSSVSCMPWM